MPVKVYGISNCDLIKKALKFFNANNISFEFHDYKKEGISPALLKDWCTKAGWQKIFNGRSTTWKEVMKAHEGLVNNQAEAIRIMQHHHSIIKRPIVESGDELVVGYDENAYRQLIQN